MKHRFLILTLLSWLCLSVAVADEQRDQVEEGIARVEQTIAKRQWHEAFQILREVESTYAKTDILHYLCAKERYSMYSRLRKQDDTREWMDRMENLAIKSGDQATIEDMLIAKALYNQKLGNSSVSKDCYLQVYHYRVKGKDEAGREQIYQSMIAEAENSSNQGMKNVITGLYTAWQDSIKAVRAAQELMVLRDSCSSALSEIAEQKSTISGQRSFIYVLLFVIAAAAAGLCALFLMLMRGNRVTHRLRNQLSASESNSQQKSLFIRNIGKQISPSLSQIAAGNTRHISSLQEMLNDVERFLSIEEDSTAGYEPIACDVSKLCQEVCDEYADSSIDIASEATKQQFNVCPDTVRQVLHGLVHEAITSSDTERIVIEFHKRTPHKGQFTVTAKGMQLDTKETNALFIPFAKVYDLSVTTGLNLPICQLLANKMNGSVSVDNTFTKGTRFVLEVMC